MELSKENQAQLDAIKQQTGNQTDNEYMAAQYKAIEQAMLNNQKAAEKSAYQTGLVNALRNYKREK